MKVLVELSVPAVGESFDVWIPDFVKIREIIDMAARSSGILSKNRYIPSGSECLCLRGKEKVLDPDAVLADYHIRNGDRLLLI